MAGIRIKEIYLSLQFIRRGPVIVPVKPCDVLAAAFLIKHQGVARHAEIALARQDANSRRILAGVSLNDFPSMIGRAVFPNDDLDRKRRSLSQRALNRLRDEWLLVESLEHHTELAGGGSQV